MSPAASTVGLELRKRSSITSGAIHKRAFHMPAEGNRTEFADAVRRNDFGAEVDPTLTNSSHGERGWPEGSGWVVPWVGKRVWGGGEAQGGGQGGGKGAGCDLGAEEKTLRRGTLGRMGGWGCPGGPKSNLGDQHCDRQGPREASQRRRPS